jgi:hypothetical protein
MDTNQNSGVSLEDVADLIEDTTTDEIDEETEAEEVDTEASDGETDDDQPEAEVEGDDEEVEFEGKAYKVPKELKEALMRQSDYTRKTQEVADQRKAVEERAQVLQQQERAMAGTFEKRVELKVIQDRLSQFEQIDWQGLADSDPAQATKLNIAYQQLQRQAQGVYGELQQAQQATEQLSQQQRQQMLVEAQKDLKQRIPNFGAKEQERIVKYAKDYGVTDEELRQVSDIAPNSKYLHILHDAAQWRALQAEKPKAMQKVAQAPQVVRPSAAQPKPKPNQAALQRLKTNGRVRDLAALL